MKIEYFSPRQCWRVRWTQEGKQVAKYFKSRTDAQKFISTFNLEDKKISLSVKALK